MSIVIKGQNDWYDFGQPSSRNLQCTLSSLYLKLVFFLLESEWNRGNAVSLQKYRMNKSCQEQHCDFHQKAVTNL